MSIFLIKSLLSFFLLIPAVLGMLTLFEILGRGRQRWNPDTMKKIHAIAGWTYILVFLVVSYFCLSFIVSSKGELSSRGTFHSVFALAILVLFCLKLLITRIYSSLYSQVKVIGLFITLLTFGMVGTSGGYYFLVTSFGTDKTFDRIMLYKSMGISAEEAGRREVEIFEIRTDRKSINTGKALFNSKCVFCHDVNSTKTIVGPGLKGVLKNQKLPVSRRPATPENIRMQLKQPLKRMPSFDYLSEEEIINIIAFLNTL